MNLDDMWKPPPGTADELMADLAHLTGGAPPILLRPANLRSSKVRNQATGRVLPCALTFCRKDGSAHITAVVPHEKPRWTDARLGTQEMREYIFCSQAHKREWCAGSAEWQHYNSSLTPEG